MASRTIFLSAMTNKLGGLAAVGAPKKTKPSQATKYPKIPNEAVREMRYSFYHGKLTRSQIIELYTQQYNVSAITITRILDNHDRQGADCYPK